MDDSIPKLQMSLYQPTARGVGRGDSTSEFTAGP